MEAGRHRWRYVVAAAYAFVVSRMTRRTKKKKMLPTWTVCMFRELLQWPLVDHPYVGIGNLQEQYGLTRKGMTSQTSLYFLRPQKRNHFGQGNSQNF
jgi:hypothetical protein